MNISTKMSILIETEGRYHYKCKAVILANPHPMDL